MDINDDSTRKEIILEAWGQGFNVGALLIIIFIVLCNYRKGILLHKLIVIEVSHTMVVLLMGMGGFVTRRQRRQKNHALIPLAISCYSPSRTAPSSSSSPHPTAGKGVSSRHQIPMLTSHPRILSGTATLLYMSYTLHNVISWIKIKPFLPRWGGRFFIISLAAVQPYWVLETWANFDYFNNLGSNFFGYSRYLEPLARLVRLPAELSSSWCM
jgi:hypothetical protein